MSKHKHTNRLIHETSPYLLQHAHNPVDWFPWGEDAFKLSREQDKPILVSIGYSACHWCHVMERESFENEEVAKIMNEHFINIKIDREERPDIDAIYMDAVQTMTGSGGWPLNVFLTPDKKPFFGGTYFPPRQAFNRSSWTDVLMGVAAAWRDKKTSVEAQAISLIEHLDKSNRFGVTNIDTDNLSVTHSTAMYEQLMKSADRVWGGFGGAPKFPQTFSSNFLLQYHHYTNNQEALHQALLNIDKILQGGIYDHLAGGIARYSTDKEWLAPHFEKMLYDNALFLILLCDAYQLTGLEKYAEAIHHIISFANNELLSKEGCYYAALDADSEGVEGKFYVWQKSEVYELLGNDAALFCEYYDITDEGNWEHSNILRVLVPLEKFATQKGLDQNVLKDLLASGRERLLRQRTKRIRPGLDDKIILSWNALMLQALAKAATVLNFDGYKVLSEQLYKALFAIFSTDSAAGELKHTYTKGKLNVPAFIEDYAYLIEACLQLYELTQDESYLMKAKTLLEYSIEHFSDQEQVFFLFTSADQKDVVIRKKEIYDGAMPSPNSSLALSLYKMGILFDNIVWKDRSLDMLSQLQSLIVKYPGSFAKWAMVHMQVSGGIDEIAVIGSGGENDINELKAIYLPGKLLLSSHNPGQSAIPYIKAKVAGTELQIYHCKGQTCFPPYKNARIFINSVKN